MVVISRTLTIGQLTFLLRVATQVLTLAGPIIIGLIILSNVPRLASFSTHDILNRIAGSLSVSKSSLRWIYSHLRGRREPQPPSRTQNPDPRRSSVLAFAVILLVLYGVFASLSDVGFLGLYTCFPPGPDEYAKPASIKSEESAVAAIVANFVRESTPDIVPLNRCEGSTVPALFNNTKTVLACTSWRNTTFFDKEAFSGINTTNSDMLMPARLGLDVWNTTEFRADTGAQKIMVPTISNGILVNPNDIGFQAIFGVPNLTSTQGFKIEKTMALEVEVGCMSLGIYSFQYPDTSTVVSDIFTTNGTWRKYSGPSILEDILANYTDEIREYSRPFFNPSTLDSYGNMQAYNASINAPLWPTPNVRYARLPGADTSGRGAEERLILTACTDSIRQRLGLPTFHGFDPEIDEYYECSLVGFGGAIEAGASVMWTMTTMLCGSTTQLNMVSATARPQPVGAADTTKTFLSLDYTRLPSTLNHLHADFWAESIEHPGAVMHLTPYLRYTLTDDPNLESSISSTSHYITTGFPYSSSRFSGGASAGYALSRVGNKILQADLFEGNGMRLVDEGDAYYGIEGVFLPHSVTRWMGQIGSSYILNSLQYHPWAAFQAPDILITNPVGPLAICYHLPYVLGFLPILLSGILVIVWSIVIIVRTPLRNLKRLRELYGGMTPYRAVVCPDQRLPNLALIWRGDHAANVHLEVFSSEKAIPMEVEVPRAVEYITLVAADGREIAGQ